MEGDQHKMREALVLCLRIIGENGIRGNVFIDDIREAHRAITAALAAPPRNCDVGTAEEQAYRMRLYCRSHGVDESGCFRCEKCLFLTDEKCELAWAQMPYEAEEGDSK